MLNEIKLGYASDPPGVEMYMQQTDKHGRQMFNKYGFPLITSSRGTCAAELAGPRIRHPRRRGGGR